MSNNRRAIFGHKSNLLWNKPWKVKLYGYNNLGYKSSNFIVTLIWNRYKWHELVVIVQTDGSLKGIIYFYSDIHGIQIMLHISIGW